MDGWRVAWGAAKGYGRFTKNVNRSVQAGYDQSRSERVPRGARRRGYLAPGDGAPPPGVDLLDYRGLDDPRVVQRTVGMRSGIALGATIDLRSGSAAGAYRLPVERFFQHIAVVAPPGKGKTYSIIVPLAVRLLRAGVSVVALDATGNLVAGIREFSAASSAGLAVPFYHWSTDRARGKHRWNPLADLDPDDLTAVEGLKTSLLGSEPADPTHRFFFDRELRILGGLIRLLVAEVDNPTLDQLLKLAVNRSVLRKWMSQPQHQSLVLELHDFLNASDEDASRMISELQTRLAPFLAPQIAPQVATSDFSLESVLRRPTLLVAGAELDLGQRGEIAGSLIVNRMSAMLAGRYGSSQGVPVVFLMDEAPVLARRIDFASLLATARATRTGVVLAAQMVTQLGNADDRSNIFDACDTFVILPGASSQSVQMFQSRMGQRLRESRSYTREYGNRHGSTSVAAEEVDVLGVREIVAPPFGQYPAFVHSRSDGLNAVPIELDRYVVNGFDA